MWDLGWLELESVALVQTAQLVSAPEGNCRVTSRDKMHFTDNLLAAVSDILIS